VQQSWYHQRHSGKGGRVKAPLLRCSSTTFRIAVRPDGAVLANTHYLAYDVAIAANDSTNLTLGITMDASDVLTVYAGSANLTFAAFGSEIV